MLKAIFRSKLTTIGLCILLFLVGIRAFGERQNTRQAEQALRDMQSRADALEQNNDRIIRDIEAAKDPAYLERLARIRLNWQRPDETVVFVYKNENPAIIS